MHPYSWLSLGPEVFEFQRRKRNTPWRIAYVTQKFIIFLLGKPRYLRVLLMVHWYLKRLSWENIQEILSQNENVSVIGATKEFLEKEVHAGVRVIDFGCATGHWSRTARSLGADVIGLDHDSESIKIARQLSPDIDFEVTTIEEFLLTNKEQMFDIGILTHILEHIESPHKLLQEIGSRVKKLIIEVPDVESDPLNFVRLTLGLPIYTDSDHVREYSMETLEQLLISQEYRIERVVRKGGTIALIASSNRFNL